MDLKKNGPLIRSLRLEQRLTQKQPAELLHLSDRTISKWERGPVFRTPDCSRSFPGSLKIPAEQLLSGELPANRKDVGNMKRIRFYRCPQCGNLLTSTNEAHISCCGRSLSPLLPRKAEGEHFFQAECSDGEWYLTTAHPMEKEHFLTFAAWVDLGRIFLVRLYPKPNGFLRLPAFKGGALYFGCSRGTGFLRKPSPADSNAKKPAVGTRFPSAGFLFRLQLP